MSLIPFHRVLIATAVVFCAGFSAWALLDFLRDGGALALALALAFAAAAAGLGYYLRHLPHFLGIGHSAGERGPAPFDE